MVKSVELRDTQAVLNMKIFTDKSMVALSCRGPEEGDVFSFQLKKSLENQQTRYDLPAKMLVLSDIEGNF